MSRMRGKVAGGGRGTGDGGWEEPETAKCVYCAFSSDDDDDDDDDDTDEEFLMPPPRKRKFGSTRGRRIVANAKPKALSPVVGKNVGRNASSRETASPGAEDTGMGGGQKESADATAESKYLETSAEDGEPIIAGAGGHAPATDVEHSASDKGSAIFGEEDAGIDDNTAVATDGAATEACRDKDKPGPRTEGEPSTLAVANDAHAQQAGEECPVCAKLFPVEELQAHVYQCLTRQDREKDEREKREERAKRKIKLAGSRPSPHGTKLGVDVRDGAGGAKGLSSSRPVEDGGKSNSAAMESSSCSEAKDGSLPTVGGKRKYRAAACGKGKAAVAAGRGSTVSAVIKPVSSVVTGLGFKCPKKLGGISTKGCGSRNMVSAQRCSKCNLLLWEDVAVDGNPVKFRLGDDVTWLEAPHRRFGSIHTLARNGAAATTVLCTYRNALGWLSDPIELKHLSPAPSREEKRQPASSRIASRRGYGSGRGEASGGGRVCASSLSSGKSPMPSPLSSTPTSPSSAAKMATAAKMAAAAATSDSSVDPGAEAEAGAGAKGERSSLREGKMAAGDATTGPSAEPDGALKPEDVVSGIAQTAVADESGGGSRSKDVVSGAAITVAGAAAAAEHSVEPERASRSRHVTSRAATMVAGTATAEHTVEARGGSRSEDGLSRDAMARNLAKFASFFSPTPEPRTPERRLGASRRQKYEGTAQQEQAFNNFGRALRKSLEDPRFGIGKTRKEFEQPFKGSIGSGAHRKAMYGSVFEAAVDHMFRESKLTSEHKFLDLGCGMGSVVLQAAAWAGCRSTGIEIVQDRFDGAVELHSAFHKTIVADEKFRALLHPEVVERQVHLLKGCFLKLWDHPEARDANFIFFNNSQGWFNNSMAMRNPENVSIESKLLNSLKNNPRNNGKVLVTLASIGTFQPDCWKRRTYKFRSDTARVATYAANELEFWEYTVVSEWACPNCTLVNTDACNRCKLCQAYCRGKRLSTRL